MQKVEPLVSVTIITYNHEKYVEKAIRSVLNQVTNFTFEIIIYDDASSDNTPSIIEEFKFNYPERIKAILQKENQWLGFGVNGTLKFAWPSAKGKYIAWLEGDDYWHDNYKLQKQLDYLESNSHVGAVFTDFSLYHESTSKTVRTFNKSYKKYVPTGKVFESLIYNNPYVTCTSMFRKKLLKSYTYWDGENINLPHRDYVLWLHISLLADIDYIPEDTAVYRVLRNSISHSDNLQKEIKFLEDTRIIQLFFAKKAGFNIDHYKIQYNIDVSIIKAAIKKRQYKLLAGMNINKSLVLQELIKEKLIRPLYNYFYNI